MAWEDLKNEVAEAFDQFTFGWDEQADAAAAYRRKYQQRYWAGYARRPLTEAERAHKNSLLSKTRNAVREAQRAGRAKVSWKLSATERAFAASCPLSSLEVSKFLGVSRTYVDRLRRKYRDSLQAQNTNDFDKMNSASKIPGEPNVRKPAGCLIAGADGAQ